MMEKRVMDSKRGRCLRHARGDHDIFLTQPGVIHHNVFYPVLCVYCTISDIFIPNRGMAQE